MDRIQQYEEMLKLDPGSRVFELLAEEFCSRGLWAEAVRVCRQGLIFHPKHLRGHVLLGWSLKELGELEEAEKLLMEAEAQVRQNALAFKLLASMAERAGDLERAEGLRDISRTLQPSPLSRAVFSSVPPSIEAPVKSEKTEAESLLVSLLDQFETKPPKAADGQKIFSEEDREQLAGVLRRLKH
ncbi:MAG TPA: hypothetical protein PKV86_13640 [Syntrophobacteraceae bacterium]|nr:hypothetical protein [Syntrophobacteraceae bacterium]